MSNTNTTPFYGRSEELHRLEQLLLKKTASLVVIKGRRRIGKSRLISEFSKKTNSFMFIGLPPEKNTSEQTQREYFATQMSLLFSVENINTSDWAHLFWELGKRVQHGKYLVVLDEINWIGSLDHTFLGKLKSAWDLYLKNNPALILILSGSMSSWIESNIMSSTGFMGRISLELTLGELPINVCNLFWRSKKYKVSSFEKFKILAITGGVPRYLEEINPDISAEENIYALAFKKGGILVNEFDRIFSDLFSKRSHRYKQIVQGLVDGTKTFQEICTILELEKSGVVSEYLDQLVEVGFLAKDYTWNIKNAKESNLCKFRLKDNYLRFFLKYIQPQINQIEKNRGKIPLAWPTVMGLQFENLVLNNIHQVISLLNIPYEHIVYDNPFFQRGTKVHPGCQIDYLIQTKFNTLYLVEIKFSQNLIGPQVVTQVEKKIKNLIYPKGFSIRPVLIHVNGVSESLLEQEYFAQIIDFGQFL